MDIATAAQQAKRMKGYFRAFEYLEEVLNEANAAQGNISIMKDSEKTLMDEVKSLRKEKTKLSGSIKILTQKEGELSASIEKKSAVKNLEDRKKGLTAELEAFDKEMVAKAAEAEKAHAAALGTLAEQYREKETELNGRLRDIEARITDAARREKATRDSLARLREKITA